MKLKLLCLGVVFLSSSALASLYCPQELVCNNGKCTGLPNIDAHFVKVVAKYYPIKNGSYGFISASSRYSGKDLNMQCDYKGLSLQTGFKLEPNKNGLNNKWSKDLTVCSPESGSAKSCPFQNP